MGMDQILDDSNPANLPGGANHDQSGADGTGGYTALGEDVCPSAADASDRGCVLGWLVADILVTANTEFIDANAAARVLLEQVKLPVFDVSRALARYQTGSSVSSLASTWISENQTVVDGWLYAARSAG